MDHGIGIRVQTWRNEKTTPNSEQIGRSASGQDWTYATESECAGLTIREKTPPKPQDICVVYDICYVCSYCNAK